MDNMGLPASVGAWAQETFGPVDLGGKRRDSRCVMMFASLAQFPSGKVAEGFRAPNEQDAACRFVENENIDVQAIMKASRLSVVERCEGDAFVFVAIDGSSVKLADHIGAKDFGTVGTFKQGAHGLTLWIRHREVDGPCWAVVFHRLADEKRSNA